VIEDYSAGGVLYCSAAFLAFTCLDISSHIPLNPKSIDCMQHFIPFQ
jgi:hypothetical protein